MKKNYSLLKKLFAFSCFFFVITALSNAQNKIEVAGLTGAATNANGVYVLQGTMQANLSGSNVLCNYWTFVSGSTTYYLYCHQFGGSFYWNIDDNNVDDKVLFYSKGYDNSTLPTSPVNVDKWYSGDATATGAPTLNAYVIPSLSVSVSQNTATVKLTDLGYPTTVKTYSIYYWNVNEGDRPTVKMLTITPSTPISLTGDLSPITLTGLTAGGTYKLYASATNDAGVGYSITTSFQADAPTGINETLAASIQLYPNPTVDGFYVNAGDYLSDLSIYSLSGSAALTKQIQGQTYVDVTSLKSGVYIVKIVTPEGTVTKKLTKK